jgi:hypothetical protein
MDAVSTVYTMVCVCACELVLGREREKILKTTGEKYYPGTRVVLKKYYRFPG